MAAPGPARRSPSTPRCPAPAPTGCTWTSSTTVWCAPRSSPPRRPAPTIRPRLHPPRRPAQATADTADTADTGKETTMASVTDQPRPAPPGGNHIELAIGGVSAGVNYATEKASVTYPDTVRPDQLIGVVEQTGYTAALPHSHSRLRLSPAARCSPRRHPTRWHRCVLGCWSAWC